MRLSGHSQYPTDAQARAEILEVGRRMYERGFVAANDGNISCRISDTRFWITPTGVSKLDLDEKTLVLMDIDGKVIGGGGKPSSEAGMHLRVYRENPQVRAICHAHPPVATSFAVAGIGLHQAILPEAVVNLGPVPVADYATPGSEGVAESVAPFCRDYRAVLLANHGALTWGRHLMEALWRMESLEHYAKILLTTAHIIGKVNGLQEKQLKELEEIRTRIESQR